MREREREQEDGRRRKAKGKDGSSNTPIYEKEGSCGKEKKRLGETKLESQVSTSENGQGLWKISSFRSRKCCISVIPVDILSFTSGKSQGSDCKSVTASCWI